MYPHRVKFSLSELKRISLGEFFDDIELSQKAMSELGLESGSDFDKSNFFANFGPTLILGTLVLVAVVLVLALLYCCLNKCMGGSKFKSCLERLKRRIFYNMLIRYTFLNCLKFFMVSLVIFNGQVEPSRGSKAAAVIFLLSLLFLPIYMGCIVYKHKASLGEEANKKKFGSLYDGRNIHVYKGN